MTEHPRLFIALELPDEIKQALRAMQDTLRRENPPVRWVAPEAMHLTLQFLGETDAALLPAIGAALRSAAGGLPLTLRLQEPGVFPNPRRPSVVWAGVGGETEALGALQARIAAALEPLGFAREARPFRPHLTLGRVRREANPAQQATLGRLVEQMPAPPPLEWRARRVVLFESELRRDGPRYTARDAVE